MKNKKGFIIIIVVIVILLLIPLGEYIYFKMSYNANHKALFSISSDGGYECGYSTIVIYDDNTYEYYKEFSEERNSTWGTYKKSNKNLLKNIIDNEVVTIQATGNLTYIVKDETGEKHYIDSGNPEMKSLLRSMFLQRFRANLNEPGC